MPTEENNRALPGQRPSAALTPGQILYLQQRQIRRFALFYAIAKAKSEFLDLLALTYFYGARYYDPRVSTWVSTDPALDEYLHRATNPKSSQTSVHASQTLGLYTYAANNPMIFVDPDGREISITKSGNTHTFNLSVKIVNLNGSNVNLQDFKNQFRQALATTLKDSSVNGIKFKAGDIKITVDNKKISKDDAVSAMLTLGGKDDNLLILQNPPADRKEGLAPIPGMVAFVNNEGNDPATTAVHEIFHNAGLADNTQNIKGNLMNNNPDTRSPGDTKLNKGQIRQIHKLSNDGMLNKKVNE